MKSIIIQIVKEFWIQTLIAIFWAFYSLNPKNTGVNINIEFVKNFGAAFFLSSWFGGQILRIIKQQKIENSFLSLFEKIELLFSKFEDILIELKGYAIGGESICYLEIIPIGKDESLQAIFLHGKYPLFDVEMTYRNLNNPEHEDIIKRPAKKIGDLAVGLVKTIDKHVIDYKNAIDGVLKYEINFYSRKGHHVQDLIVFKFENIWHSALQIREKDQIVFSKIPDNFPIKNPFSK